MSENAKERAEEIEKIVFRNRTEKTEKYIICKECGTIIKGETKEDGLCNFCKSKNIEVKMVTKEQSSNFISNMAGF